MRFNASVHKDTLAARPELSATPSCAPDDCSLFTWLSTVYVSIIDQNSRDVCGRNVTETISQPGVRLRQYGGGAAAVWCRVAMVRWCRVVPRRPPPPPRHRRGSPGGAGSAVLPRRPPAHRSRCARRPAPWRRRRRARHSRFCRSADLAKLRRRGVGTDSTGGAHGGSRAGPDPGSVAYEPGRRWEDALPPGAPHGPAGGPHAYIR